MLKRSIQGAFSTNCIAAVPFWKRDHSGSVTRKLAIDPSSATQRTPLTCSSRPKANSKAPMTIGSQMARLNRPIFVFSPQSR